ncbi:cytochrome c1 2, heme protein, mitochondrial isoform X3 [Vigna angularis]|uniref:cytochrome c1 2, heme protein, mitochondrial isoform X3 n=1 Tax=Phaseolus angularis TaxID=3914 RepID=UPI0022B4E188|nr:cytochrome c1 2, heme protein, mitochondrial isoform X3 [Vigna angularis]XP_052723342.1 cytochrome c1 2, heme protein, mitochondrial isoform X3 [Vigna angularis]
MAGGVIRQLLRRKLQSCSSSSSFTSPVISKIDGANSTGSNSLRALALVGAGVTGILSFSTTALADEAEHGLACPSYPWPHKGILCSYDHASIFFLARIHNIVNCILLYLIICPIQYFTGMLYSHLY